MNADAKQKWVAALRSGELKQGTERLQTKDGGFCCLGVACIVAEREGVAVQRDSASGRIVGALLGESQPAVAKWLGGIGFHVEGGLAERNDGKRQTFGQIADYIEKGVE